MLIPDTQRTRRFQPHVTALAVEAATALFASYGLSLSPVTTMASEAQGELAFIALTKFAGPHLVGTLVLGCGPHTLAASIPAPASPRDWMGELANQHFGRLKNALLRKDIELWGVPPSVVSGRHLVPIFDRTHFAPAIFTDGAGDKICMWLEIDVSAQFQFVGPNIPVQDVPTEGDVIMF